MSEILSLEDYEKECDRIIAENDKYLDLFVEDLEASGLSSKTIRKHLNNAAFYLNEYLLHDEPREMRDGPYLLDEFLGSFFIRKCMWSTPATIRSTATSIRKFYRSMLDHGMINITDYDYLYFDIKENMDFWQEQCAIYNDPKQENLFFFF